MNQSKALLKRFKGKGGITGAIAGYYAGSHQKSAMFLLELKDQLKTNKAVMEKIWGKKLIKDLEKFSEKI